MMSKIKYNEYDMWLSEKVGNRIREALELSDELGGAEAIYQSDAFPKWQRDISVFRKSLEIMEKYDIKICGIYDDEYPDLLKNIYDPPYLLYYRGRLEVNNKHVCAIVGARKATSYGRSMSYDIGKILGQNEVIVVSGMALGADACAHRGCLDGNGNTVAVLGSGVDICTPSSNLGLRDRILDSGGCVISECLPGTPGYAANYPRRNRIISGMSESIIVVEADERSGTSITANMALEQGRDVFALPGNINSVMSRGTNRLIKEGAIPLISKENILEEMGFAKLKINRSVCALGADELELYETVEKSGSIDLDELCRETGKNPSQVAALVGILEIKGYFLIMNGKIVIAK